MANFLLVFSAAVFLTSLVLQFWRNRFILRGGLVEQGAGFCRINLLECFGF